MTIREIVEEARRVLDAGGELSSEQLNSLLAYYERHVAAQEREVVHQVLVGRNALYQAVFALSSRVFALRRRVGLDDDRVRALLDVLSDVEREVDRFSEAFDPIDREFEERVSGE